MSDSLSFERSTVEFVVKILESQEFFVEQNPVWDGKRGPDLLVRSASSTACVEIKSFRSLRLSTSSLRQAVSQLVDWRKEFECEWGILVIFSMISNADRAAIAELNDKIVIYDLNSLKFLSLVREDLKVEFQNLIAKNYPFSDPSKILAIQPELSPLGGIKWIPEPARLNIAGRNLCNRIREIPTGRKHFREFEKACRDALMYAFENDLTGWFDQKRSESGISIYDTVCRITSEHDLWLTIAQHFNSKYVIFEYKNYRNKIKQGQIYTTEKYLYKPALRCFAIIVSRTGADKNAEQACKGALREHGKLILNLSIDDLCQILKARDDGDDPSALLVEKLDKLLIEIDR